jgi:hypothetical protein
MNNKVPPPRRKVSASGYRGVRAQLGREGLVSLDSRRDPHPDRVERLKTLPPARNEEMQQLMRECHENPSVRAAVVTRARTQLDDQAAPQRRAARMRKVKHYAD